jgi:hypothetical protein
MEEIRCEEVRKKLRDYRAQRLIFPEKGQVERHLFYCPDCVSHLALIVAHKERKEVVLFR